MCVLCAKLCAYPPATRPVLMVCVQLVELMHKLLAGEWHIKHKLAVSFPLLIHIIKL